MRPEDDFTSTVDGAAGFEAQYGLEFAEPISDYEEELERRVRPCTARDLSECFCEHH